MIEITDGFTRISTGSDHVVQPAADTSGSSQGARKPRDPTGARVTLDFHRDEPLPPGEAVKVRFDAAGDGCLRESIGIAQPTRVVVHWGHSVVYHYRVSCWIEPAALMQFVAGNVRSRNDERASPPRQLTEPASGTG